MRSHGITRIELAVALTVVVVSAALLLPAFGAVKDDLTLCLRRSLNLSEALLRYAEDHDGVLPPGKYGHQGGHPVPWVWMDLLYKQGYVETKEEFQCPADDVTDNASMYYDYGPRYPDWWASYALPMNLCDLFWHDRTPHAAVLANHEGMFDKQVLLGESEANFIEGYWLGWGDAPSFKMAYEDQFPFDRHKGFCVYVMLDGRGKAMRVPVSDEADAEAFRTAIQSQLETCEIERSSLGGPGDPHVCFWNRYRRGAAASYVESD
jgi:hypothetical protein